MKIDVIFGGSDDVLVKEIRNELGLSVTDNPTSDAVVISMNNERKGSFCIGVIKGAVDLKIVKKFDLIVSPFARVVEYYRDRGFYCFYAPIHKGSQKLSTGKAIGVPEMTPEILFNLTEVPLVLHIIPSLEDWAVALNKKIKIWEGEESDFFSEVQRCIVSNDDDYYAVRAAEYSIPCVSVNKSKSFTIWRWRDISANLYDMSRIRDEEQGFTVIK